jgi:hypothetical protein
MTVTALAFTTHGLLAMETTEVRKSYPGKGLIRYNAVGFTAPCALIVETVDFTDTLFPQVKFRIRLEPGQGHTMLSGDGCKIAATFARP